MSMRITGSPEEPLTLRFFNDGLARYIGDLGSVWIKAEVISPKKNRGHVYGTLQDDGYRIPFVIWSSAMNKVPNPLPEHGTTVLCLIKPSFYAKNGSLSAVVREMKMDGISGLIAQVEETRYKLKEEGLFDQSHKKPIPLLPNKIGLVVGEQTDAQKDVTKNALELWPYAEFVIENAQMQGPNCASSVQKALQVLEDNKEVEVIIVARGGGDYQDLIGFSDENLIRFVYTLKTPIISAIGHEQDNPILDNVADFRASTPTGAGRMVVIDMQAHLAEISDLQLSLKKEAREYLFRRWTNVQQLKTQIPTPKEFINISLEKISAKKSEIKNISQRELSNYTYEITSLKERLDALSPKQVMRRGYALARTRDQIITSTDEINFGQEVIVELAEGSFDSVVLNKY